MIPLALHLAQDPDADALLSRDPLALLVGMLLDQQIPMERAFVGPYRLAQRLGAASLDAAAIAVYDPDGFAGLMSTSPALHRYPGAMAGRVQTLCRQLIDEYGGDATAVWEGASSGAELLRRVRALPGFGEQKAKIFVALLGKQLGVQPEGWREAAGPYGQDGTFLSVADVADAASVAKVRAFKQAAKQAAKQR